jgi:hypothetical protein
MAKDKASFCRNENGLSQNRSHPLESLEPHIADGLVKTGDSADDRP